MPKDTRNPLEIIDHVIASSVALSSTIYIFSTKELMTKGAEDSHSSEYHPEQSDESTMPRRGFLATLSMTISVLSWTIMPSMVSMCSPTTVNGLCAASDPTSII